MRRPPEVSLGDLVRAVDRLGLATSGDVREAAELLGLLVSVPSVQDPWIQPAGFENVSEFGVSTLSAEEPPPAEPDSISHSVPAAGDEFLLWAEGQMAVRPPSWARGDLLTRPPAEDLLREVEPPALLSAATTRALLTALVSGVAESGPVDVERMIETVSRGRPLPAILRRYLPTLRYGVQVLVDRGPALLPYRVDQQRVVRGLQALVGRSADRLQILRFAGTPCRVGPGTPRTWSDYTPPPAGATVLVLSDLGLIRGTAMERSSSLDDWIGFADRVRRSGARPTALVPYDPRRWPGDLRRRMALVYWDRGTTVAEVRIRRPRRAMR